MNADTEVYLGPRSHIPLSGKGITWLDNMRTEAADQFAENGLPTLRDEDWKYTNVRPITKLGFKPFRPLTAHSGQTQLRHQQIDGLATLQMVFVNGFFSAQLSRLAGLPAEVKLQSLEAMLAQDADRIQPTLGSCLPENKHGFSLLNTAYINDGAYIEIPAGCELETPIELLFVIDGSPDAQVAQPRNLIIAGDNSRCTVIERYIGVGGQKTITNTITEVLARPGSKIDHYKLQQENDVDFHISGLFVSQDRDSEVTNHNIAIGAALSRSDIRFNLRGTNASCVLNGLYLGSGKQHIDNHTQIDHVVPNCSSDEFYKGVLTDRARAVFHGRIVVHQGAQKTDAQQQNNNLLLSKDAEVDTKPQLEIYADDVKCSHGATVGQLDSNALFYLLSRGIEANLARSLLTFAFASDVISRVRLPALRDSLEQLLPDKLHRRPLEDLV